MKEKVNLSIIIVNFNTYQFLKNCLESIFQGGLVNESYEIIVIDNASNDEIVKSLPNSYPQVRLIANKKNIGFAKANNQGIKLATGNFILLLNPDTIIERNVLKMMLEFMNSKQTVGIATCRVDLPSGKLDDACHRGFPTPWRAFCQFSGLASIFWRSELLNGYHLGYKNMGKIHEIDSCVGAFMLIRKQVISDLGGLDEDYFWYGEDLDLCFRAKKLGWKVMYVPSVKIIHFKGTSSGIKRHSEHISSADKKIQLLATKSRFAVMRIFYRKHYRNVYPKWLTSWILAGIKIKEYFALLKYQD